MNKKLSIVLALMLAMSVSLSGAFAIHITSSLFYVHDHSFSASCWISDNAKQASASTTGGPGTYNKVWATFYWIDLNTGTVGTYPDSPPAVLYSNTSASINAPSLSGTTQQYFKVVSDHRGEYGGDYTEVHHLVVTLDD